jgi:hypothetical protein
VRKVYAKVTPEECVEPVSFIFEVV